MNPLDKIFKDPTNKKAIRNFLIFMTSDEGIISHNKGVSFFYSSGFDQVYDGLYAFKNDKLYHLNNKTLKEVLLKIPVNYQKIIQNNYKTLEKIN